MAGEHILNINQGETFQKGFQWVTGDESIPVNLTGYVGRCHIRNGAQNQGIIIVVPVTITDAVNGRFSLNLTAAETSLIPTTGVVFSDVEKYVYDVEFSIGERVYRVLNDYVYISPEVTR